MRFSVYFLLAYPSFSIFVETNSSNYMFLQPLVPFGGLCDKPSQTHNVLHFIETTASIPAKFCTR